jgi:large subunit ribosomal protein L10
VHPSGVEGAQTGPPDEATIFRGVILRPGPSLTGANGTTAGSAGGGAMENPRSEKVAVVDEVRERLGAAAAAVVTEYRGLTVAELAELRRNLAAAGGDYKIYKNTLVRLAIAGGNHEPLGAFLTGPTAIAFVGDDISAVAKALREFSRANPSLVVKGGLLDGGALSATDLGALADLPSRDVLLARLAGAIIAPLSQMAGLLQALPRNLAYGLSALVEQKGGAPAPAGVTEEPETPPAAEAVEEPAGVTEEPETSPAAEAVEEPAEQTEVAGEAAEPAESAGEDPGAGE